MKKTNRVLSITLLFAGLGLLYQCWNDNSWFIQKVRKVLEPPTETPTLCLTVAGTPDKNCPATENKDAAGQSEPQLNMQGASNANAGAKDLTTEPVKVEAGNPNAPQITLTSLDSKNNYPADATTDAILKLKADCWIEIKDASQKVLVSGHNKKGKEFTLDRTKTPFTAKTPCKPENIDLLLDGKKKSFKFDKKNKSYQLNIDF